MYRLLKTLLLVQGLLLAACGSDNGSPSKTASSAASQAPASVAAQSSAVAASSIAASASSTSLASSSSSSLGAAPFTLSTTSFEVGAQIPAKFTCNGTQVSPQLAWDINSTEVKSFALVVDDPDGIPIVGYAWSHWNVYQIPASARQIPEGASLTSAMPVGSLEGTNHDGVAKYSGPCPPGGTGVHRYVFAVYALNVASLDVNLGQALNRSAFEAQYASAIIQKVEINAVYGQ